MKKLTILLCLAILFAGCAPAQQVTITPAQRATLTPPPTATIIPTPTLSPAFLAVQEQIAGSTQDYSIMGNGNIEGKLPDGTIGVIPGIRLNPDGQGYTIMVDGQSVTVGIDQVSITDEDGVTVNGYQNLDGDDDYEKITSYTLEDIAKLNNTEILAVAPVMEGLEKFISPAGKHIVLYRNSERRYVQAYNLLTHETVDIIHVSTDPEKPTKIIMEDLTSGKLAMSEKLQCPGFSDKAIPIDWKQVKAEGFFTAVQMWNQTEDYSDPETRPQKFCSFSEITVDLGRGEMPYILIGVAQLNKDRSVGFFHVPTRPEHLAQVFAQSDETYFWIMTEELRKNSPYPESKATIDMYSDMKELGQQMEAVDVLPQALENRLIAAVVSGWE